MKIRNAIAFIIAVICLSMAALTNVQAQTIASVSANTQTRSGRLKITGSNFGATQGAVQIGGVNAPVSSWSDTSITAYVGETTALGNVNVQVSAATGNSNLVQLAVTLRPAAEGRVRWRFQVDAPYINGRPAIGADGTIYSADVRGHLYALRPDGGLKWIFNAAPGGPVGQSVDVGADGTIYFARGNAVYAVNPDGTQKWRVADEISFQAVKAGPNVGPDGNIYAATVDFPQQGLGFFVVSPAGQILRNTPGFFEGDNTPFFAREIFFGSNRIYHTLNNQNNPDGSLSVHQLGGAFLFERSAMNDRNPAVAPDGTVYIVVPPTTSLSNSNLRAVDPNGNVLRIFFGENTNYLSSPDVGADGTIYIGRNLKFITALNPNGSQKWEFTGSGILGSPTVNPQNSVVAIGGYSINAPGFVHGIGANNGQLLWTVTLPQENGGYVRPQARPKFSRNGSTVYVGMSLSSTSPDVYSYLYAIQATDEQQINQAKPFDFDGDGKADVSVFRPSDGTWYLNNSQSGFASVQLGLSGDKTVAADYDGDGKVDVAVYRGGIWYLLQSSNNQLRAVSFGLAGDIPQTGDFDADGKADFAVFRPSNGTWYLSQSTNGFTAFQFGVSGDKPVANDFDGDGKTDAAVYRDGIWHVLQSRDGFNAVQFGTASDTPTASDYDGDGKADFAVYRAGTWYLLRSRDGFFATEFGLSSDVPTPADYDGDGKTDIAIFREGIWYLLNSQQGFGTVQFGTTNDRPIPAAINP